jgi:ribonuclease P protein component
MVPKKNKISRKSYTDLGRPLSSQHTEYLTFRARETSDGIFRVGVIVPKIVAKHAIERNLLKRRIYSFFQGKIMYPATYLIFCKKKIKELTHSELSEHLYTTADSFIEK